LITFYGELAMEEAMDLS